MVEASGGPGDPAHGTMRSLRTRYKMGLLEGTPCPFPCPSRFVSRFA